MQEREGKTAGAKREVRHGHRRGNAASQERRTPPLARRLLLLCGDSCVIVNGLDPHTALAAALRGLAAEIASRRQAVNLITNRKAPPAPGGPCRAGGRSGTGTTQSGPNSTRAGNCMASGSPDPAPGNTSLPITNHPSLITNHSLPDPRTRRAGGERARRPHPPAAHEADPSGSNLRPQRRSAPATSSNVKRPASTNQRKAHPHAPR